MSKIAVNEITNEAGTGGPTLPNGIAGGLTLGGDLTLDTNGIYLGGTGSANYLEDYEEGTWTPIIDLAYGAATALDTIQTGTYIKTGKKVYLQGKITASSPQNADASVDRMIIGSLPFSVDSIQFASAQVGTGAGFCINSTGGNSAEIFSCAVQDSSNEIVIWAVSEHGSATLGYLSFGVVYETV